MVAGFEEACFELALELLEPSLFPVLVLAAGLVCVTLDAFELGLELLLALLPVDVPGLDDETFVLVLAEESGCYIKNN